MKKKSLGQFGFSLIEVMIVTGIMTLLGLGLATVMSNSTKNQKRIEQKESVISASSYLRSVLQNNGMCRNAFCTTGVTCGDRNLTGLVTTLDQNSEIVLSSLQSKLDTGVAQSILAIDPSNAATYRTNINNSGANGNLIRGTSGLYVTDLRLKNFSYKGLQGGSRVFDVDLVITYIMDASKILGAQPKPELIRLLMMADHDVTGRISLCSSGTNLDSLWEMSSVSPSDIRNKNSGGVGIGTDNLSSGFVGQLVKLKVSRPTTSVGILIENDSAGSTQSDLVLRMNTNNADQRNVQIVNSTNQFSIRTLNDNGLVGLNLLTGSLANGNVGVGTTAPASRLDVNGNLTLSGGSRTILTESGGNLNLQATGAASILMQTNAVNRVTIASNGLIDFAGDVNLSGGNRVISSINANALTVRVPGSGPLNLSTNGANQLIVGADGNVNISNNQTVFGAITVNGTALLSSDVTSGGVTIPYGGLRVQNAGGLNVNGASSLSGATTIVGATSVTGNMNLNGSINHSGGNIIGSGANSISQFVSYTTTSDRRLKNELEEIGSQSENIQKIKTYKFRYNHEKPSVQHFGVIAQDIQKIYPQLVSTTDDGYLNVNYPELIPILIKALQESNQRLKKLESEIGINNCNMQNNTK